MKIPRKLNVNVTEHDIAAGIPEESNSCPIALAVYRQYPDAIVDVDGCNIVLNNAVFPLPEPACEFIDNFDSEHAVKPFSFEASVDVEDFKETINMLKEEGEETVDELEDEPTE